MTVCLVCGGAEERLANRRALVQEVAYPLCTVRCVKTRARHAALETIKLEANFGFLPYQS